MIFAHARELRKYRQLIWVLAWCDFKGRYKHSILGYLWSLLEPFLMFVVLYLVFSNIMKVTIPYYPLFLLLGIIMWNYFSKTTTLALNVFIWKQNLVKKVYFPRDIIVISNSITTAMTGFFESLVFIAFLLLSPVTLTPNILFLAVILPFYFILALGVSLLLAPLNALYRDFQYIWTVALQAGFFLTPIVYPLDIFPSWMQAILSLNPVAQLMISTRDSVLYGSAPGLAALGYGCIISLVLLGIGYWIFGRLEPRLAEEL